MTVATTTRWIVPTDLTDTALDEAIWLPPTYSAPDWIELCGLLMPAGTMPTTTIEAEGFSLPLASAAAARRALVLSIAHRMPGRLSEEANSGRRKFTTWHIRLPRSERQRFDVFIRQAARCIGLGHDWLTETPHAVEFARAHWRAMLLVSRVSRNRTSKSVTIRAGNQTQAAALRASSMALGASPSIGGARREERFRIEFSEADYLRVLNQIQARVKHIEQRQRPAAAR